MHSSLLSALLSGSLVLAQAGQSAAPFPNITYPDAVSPNPNVFLGTQSNQQSPPKYPSPWGTGQGDWAQAYEKAMALVEQMTLDEKVNLTTGFPDGGTLYRGVNVAATFDRDLAYMRGKLLGEEHRDKGVNVALGPVAGPLGRSPEGGRNWEGFSPDPYLTGVLFADTIKGMQSAGVMASAKHFIGNEQEHFRQIVESIDYGFNITQPGSSNIDDQTLHELYLWPFADGVRAGAASIMCSYNLLNNSQACQNSYMQNYILKGELGFQGHILSDWQATASGVSAILAGLDVSMPGDTSFNTGYSYFGPNLTIAVLNGTVPQWRLDDMAVRTLASWFYVDGDTAGKDLNFQSWTSDVYGPIHAYAGPEYAYGLVNQHVDVREQHGQFIRRLGAASTVLLKNEKNTLPLSGHERLTAVFGEDAGDNPAGPNGCRNRGCDIGTLAEAWGSGQGEFPYLVTPRTALQNEVVSHYGAFEAITNNSALAEIAALGKLASEVHGVCIAFANADSGEGFINVDGNIGDRKNLTLWQGAPGMLANLTANCNNTVLVVHGVGPVELEVYKQNPNVTAILWAGLPGEQSGNAITDVLYGRTNPGAKLPFTIGKQRSDYGTDVLYTPNQLVPQFNFREGVFIDYRTFDHRNITPTYEFGYGLSYTTFDYSNLEVQSIEAGDYAPNTNGWSPAPTFGSINNSGSAYLFPSNLTRVPLYIYPWLNSTNLSRAYGADGYGDSSFVPEGALDGSSIEAHPAGGAPGGNPLLWDVLYRVTADITNTGPMGGIEVPQLYVSLGGPYDPKTVLRGFKRLAIQPGETVKATFDLKRRDLSNWDTVSQNWQITDYTKTIYVGSSSRKLPLSAVLR
ncbi:glycoside hydrolase family 3 protein [Hortaea werneckii]|nr:glycoside hydrolase family 3 protein [Hortaea werneckii]